MKWNIYHAINLFLTNFFIAFMYRQLHRSSENNLEQKWSSCEAYSETNDYIGQQHISYYQHQNYNKLQQWLVQDDTVHLSHNPPFFGTQCRIILDIFISFYSTTCFLILFSISFYRWNHGKRQARGLRPRTKRPVTSETVTP